MRKRAWVYAAWAALGAAGCLPEGGSSLPTVPDGRLAAPVPSAATMKAFHAPATEAVALRVNAAGQKLVAANPKLPFTPTFQAVGSPDPELFHRETVIYISEGLASRATSEGQLTALLATELGRLVSEREAVQALKGRKPERDPSPAMDIGRDSGGAFGAADGTRLAELAQMDRGRRPRVAPPPPPPDPKALAQLFAERAGVSTADLNAVAPLVREAGNTTTLQQQIGNGGALVVTPPTATAPAAAPAAPPATAPATVAAPAPVTAGAAPPAATPAAPTPIASTPNIPPGAVLLTPSASPAAPPAR